MTESIFDVCKTPNYTDPRLKLWKREELENPEPQFYKTDGYTYASCIFRNITIDNKTEPCPPFIIRIPIMKEFQVGDYSHDVNVTYLKSSNEIQPNKMIHINDTAHHEDYNDLSALVNTIKTLNRKLIGQSEAISKPWTLPEFWTMNALTLCSIIITVGICAFKMFTRSGHNESVVINNNVDPINETRPLQNERMPPWLEDAIEEQCRLAVRHHDSMKLYPTVNHYANLQSSSSDRTEDHYKAPSIVSRKD